jgi:hypothetical protein
MQIRRYAGIGLAVDLAGFALAFAGQGLFQMGLADIDSGIAVLSPAGDLLYGLGLVIVVASAAYAGAPIKYIVAAGTAMGIGLFFKSAIHEVHIYSGLGFGLDHSAHVGIGAIIMTVATAALAVQALRSRAHHSAARVTQ